MTSVSRFSVSLDSELLNKFDEQVKQQGYPTRSKAVADLISQSLVQQEWKEGDEVAAAIVLVYDHHKHNLSHQLTHVQHDCHQLIISTQHVHLDHDSCLEIIVSRGQAKDIQTLTNRLKAIKGVKYVSLAAASTGHDL